MSSLRTPNPTPVTPPADGSPATPPGTPPGTPVAAPGQARRPERAGTPPGGVGPGGAGARPLLPARRGPAVSDDLLTLALGLLLLAAIVPLRSTFVDTDWVRPVAGGVGLAVGIGWGARRLGVGPFTHLVMTTVSLLVFVTIAFLPTTALAGLVPTPDTLAALRDLFLRGLELVELRPSPTFTEPGLLLLAVAGTWTVAYLADGMLFVLRSPLKAVACALVLWAVPLAVAPQSESITLAATTLLAAAALILLLGSAITCATFGVNVTVPGRDGRPRTAPVVRLPGVALGLAAIVAGLLFAQVLPGFDDEPLYEARGGSGTTITTNPIVDIRARLVASDTGPVVLVDSPRPVYLRTTSLDRYEADEQWTAGTISGDRVSGAVDDPPTAQFEPVEVTVEIDASIEAGAVLAPAPFQPLEVSGPKAAVLRYDRSSSTLTVPGDQALVDGDTYTVRAAIPQPEVDALRLVPLPGVGSPGTELPPDVPPEVITLARQIVDDAGAQTMFDAALAVQDHLRAWEYSTDPEPGLGSTAMTRFIDAQEGYCEQFAGTMAVMLRSLGIPARLAVGYTPGELLPDGRWEVTNGNAHAWVEVDFGTRGFITFEPTPRTDGNVLVTSPDAVVPSQTQAQAEGLADSLGPAAPSEAPAAQPPAFPSEDPFALEPGAVPQGSAAEGGVPVWALVLAVLASFGVGGALLVRRAGAVDVGAPPTVRIDAARRRVERVGRAVGRRRHPAETDGEYFVRIADGDRAGLALAVPATRSVFAPAVAESEAEAAEGAAGRLVHGLTADLPWWRRGVVAVRSAVGR